MGTPTDYYVLRSDGDQTGPFGLDQLRVMLASGQVNLDMAYWHEGMPEWMSLWAIQDQLKPVQSAPASSPPPFVPSVPITPAEPIQEKDPEPKKSGCFKIGGLGCLWVFGLLSLLWIVLATFPHPNQGATTDTVIQTTPVSVDEITLGADDTFVLTNKETISTWKADMDVSNDPRVQAMLDSIRRASINGDSDTEIDAYRKALDNMISNLVDQRLNLVETQYLQDGRGLKIAPGKYKVTAFYNNDGNDAIARENATGWAAITHTGRTVYAVDNNDQHDHPDQ